MNLIHYNPTRNPWRIRDEMDRFFNHFIAPTFEDDEMTEVNWSPRVDISEREDSFSVRAELAGLNRDDVKITMREGVLTIKGEKKEEAEHKDQNHHICERRYGKFIRSFRLPAPVSEKKIDASFKDGILNLTLPKAEEAKPKEIEIKMN